MSKFEVGVRWNYDVFGNYAVYDASVSKSGRLSRCQNATNTTHRYEYSTLWSQVCFLHRRKMSRRRAERSTWNSVKSTVDPATGAWCIASYVSLKGQHSLSVQLWGKLSGVSFHEKQICLSWYSSPWQAHLSFISSIEIEKSCLFRSFVTNPKESSKSHRIEEYEDFIVDEHDCTYNNPRKSLSICQASV